MIKYEKIDQSNYEYILFSHHYDGDLVPFCAMNIRIKNTLPYKHELISSHQKLVKKFNNDIGNF